MVKYDPPANRNEHHTATDRLEHHARTHPYRGHTPAANRGTPNLHLAHRPEHHHTERRT